MEPTPTPIALEVITNPLGTTSAIIQIISGVTLALFALLAFIVQRARYLVETEITVEPILGVVKLSSQRDVGWRGRIAKIRYLDITFDLMNNSARELGFTPGVLSVMTFDDGDIPPQVATEIGHGPRIEFVPKNQTLEIRREFEFDIDLGATEKEWRAIFFYQLKLNYQRDILQFIVQPWTLGKRSMDRVMTIVIRHQGFPEDGDVDLNVTKWSVAPAP